MLKLIFFSILIALLIWLSVIPNSIVINYDHYQLSTTLTKLLILLIIVILPLYGICYYLRIIYKKLISSVYTSSTLSMLNSLELNENKAIIYNIITRKPTAKFVKAIKRINQKIKQKNYEDAIQIISKVKKNKSNQLIFNQYLVTIYLKTNNHAGVVNICKQSLALNPKSYWFYQQLLKVIIQNNLSAELNYLIQALNKLNIDGTRYNNIYGLLYYAKAKNASENNSKSGIERANAYCKKIISVNPKFLPAYELLFKHLSSINEQKKINEYLNKLWLKIPTIEAINLWDKYYNNNTIDSVQKIIQLKPNQAMNNLLLATIYIKLGEYLQAEDILNKTQESIDKNIIYLNLINKTASHSQFNAIITKLNQEYFSNLWWFKYL